MTAKTVTREQRRARDLKNFRWFGTVHLDNVDHVASAVQRLLVGSRFTVVEVRTYRDGLTSTEVHPSQELSSRGVESLEGSDYLGFRINARDHSWSFRTRVDGPRDGGSEPGHDRFYNRPYGKFIHREGPSFRWTGKTPDGAVVTWVFAVEYDQKMDLVWDVMEA